jgi:hypothetical protein
VFAELSFLRSEDESLNGWIEDDISFIPRQSGRVGLPEAEMHPPPRAEEVVLSGWTLHGYGAP